MTRIFVSIMMFGAAVGVFFGLTIPVISEVKKDSAISSKMAQDIEQFKELEKQRNDIVAKYSSVSSDDLRKLDIALPEQISAINLIAQIDDMAKTRGLSIKKIDIEQPKPGKQRDVSESGELQKYNTVSIIISVSGSYDVFIGFLSDLEKSLQIIDIKQVDFTVGAKADYYDFSIRANTYYAGNQ